MQIKISKDWWQHYVREQCGKTQAEKESRAEHIWSSPGRKWAKGMVESQGQWLDVETKFLFEEQFNTKNMRVMVKHIDGIKFSPEFQGIDEFEKAVKARYAKDWPGSVTKCKVLRAYIKSGFIKVV